MKIFKCYVCARIRLGREFEFYKKLFFLLGISGFLFVSGCTNKQENIDNSSVLENLVQDEQIGKVESVLLSENKKVMVGL